MAAGDVVKDRGEANDLADRIAQDPAFGMTRAQVDAILDPARHTGRAAQQVDIFVRDFVEPVLARYDVADAVPDLRA
jgi:adenylosuccinate lyase